MAIVNNNSSPAIITFAALVFYGAIATASPTQARPWILLDASSGKVIAQNQATRPWYPASLVKMMTAYTVFRELASGRIDLASPVRVSKLATSAPPSKMRFPAGTILNIDNALKIIMVKSANDVAIALAQSTKGNLPDFIKAMNANSVRLGMNGTKFTNPHGLHSPGQFTTARDMALLALQIKSEFPQYADYFNIPAITYNNKPLKNSNRLLTGYRGTTGMKTGFTCASGLNIVARAKRAGRQLIVVVLGGFSAVERNAQTAQLLNAGFADRFDNRQRPHIRSLQPEITQYALPGNLRAMICRPNWTERQMTKKQRRAVRKIHLAYLKNLRETYLGDTIEIDPPVKINLGRATGANPYNFNLKKAEK